MNLSFVSAVVFVLACNRRVDVSTSCYYLYRATKLRRVMWQMWIAFRRSATRRLGQMRPSFYFNPIHEWI